MSLEFFGGNGILPPEKHRVELLCSGNFFFGKRILDGFDPSASIDMANFSGLTVAGNHPSRFDSVHQNQPHLGWRTTSATPKAVSSVPNTVVSVMGSANKIQAMKAVTGGTRYIRLVTEAAAPF